MLGNMEELRDYHKHVMLPKMETAVDNAVIMRWVVTQTQTSNLTFIIDMNIRRRSKKNYARFPEHNQGHFYLQLMNYQWEAW